MAKQVNKLNDFRARALTECKMHADGGGLFLNVKPQKGGGFSRSWIVRLYIRGRMRKMGLGAFGEGPGEVNTGDARKLARAALEAVKEGRDPIAEREQARLETRIQAKPGMTFRDAAHAHIEMRKGEWKGTSTKAQWEQTLADFVFPEIGSLPCADVTRAHVVAILKPHWHTMRETARRIRARIESILDWEATLVGAERDNPARLAIVKNLLGKQNLRKHAKHFDALPYKQVGGFMVDLRARKARTAKALEVVILTCVRSNEARGVRRREIDLDNATWTIPGERMKGGEEHTVPLSRQAVALFRELLETTGPEPDALLFPGQKPGKPLSTLINYLQETMKRPDITVHGFRSTFRDWAGEETTARHDITESVLAHAIGSQTQRAYQRGKLLQHRHELMQTWADYCETVAASADIVTLTRAA